VVVTQGGREVARSEPVQILVRAPAQAPPVSAESAQNLERNAGQPLFLQAETARTHYYVGEPFSLSWNLYFQTQVQVTGAEFSSKPALQGLLAEELMGPDDQLRVREKNIGGRTYRYVVRSLQLATGLEAGTVTIDPMALRVGWATCSGGGRRPCGRRPSCWRSSPYPWKGGRSGFRKATSGGSR
jgi:hypothetical protein